MQAGYLKEWLGEKEDEFRRDLQGVSLVIEADIDENLTVQASESFGRYAGILHRVHQWSGVEIAKRFPALTLVSLVSHAATDYEQNRYWESYWVRLGIPREQSFETDFRQSVPGLLQKFQLARFPQLDRKYVQQLAMHAGIPNYCLRGVLDVIANHLDSGREPTGAALIEWLGDPAKPHRMNGLNVPARNFLREGGEFAVDIIDRILEFVLYVADRPSDWLTAVDSGEISSETTGLPSVMLDGLVDILEELGLPTVSTSVRPDGRTISIAPYLELDTVEDTVMVRLPHPGSNLLPTWSVSLDGDVSEIRGVTGWGSAEGQPPTSLAVIHPVRAVSVSHPSSNAHYNLPLVESSDPLVLFTESGRFIGRREPMPVGAVYAILPKNHSLTDGTTGRILEPDLNLGVPSGWVNWRLITLSTVDVRSVQLVDLEGGRVGSARVVRHSCLPELLLDDPIGCVTSANGRTVYGARPTLWLPRHPVAGEATRWQVSVRRLGDRAVVAQQSWESRAQDLEIDPFDGAPAGQLGAFEVLVRGPLGSDLRQTVFLAEGLSALASSPFRTPIGSGLSPATVLVECVEPLVTGSTGLDFDAATRQRNITVDSGARSEQLTVSPRHLEFRVDKVGQRPEWSALPHVSTPDEFVADQIIAVRVPSEEADVYIELVDADRTVVQAEKPHYRPSADAFEVRTVRFTDTVRALGAGQIVVTVDVPGCARVVVPAVHIRPARLCTSMMLQDGVIRFAGLAPIGGLALQVWCESAPWRPSVSLPVTDERLTVPESLRDVGTLLACLAVDDGWGSVSMGTTPNPEATRLAQPGWSRDVNPALDHLSRLLVGLDCKPEHAVGSPELWSALAAQTGDTPDSIRIRNMLHGLLLRDPRASIEAMGASGLPADVRAELLVRSQLVLQSFDAYGVRNEISQHPWVACVCAVADLPSLSLGSDIRVDVEASALREGGAALLEIMRTGSDPYRKRGLFDAGTVKMSEMTNSHVKELFELASIIPTELVEPDTRVVAIGEAFAVRERWAKSRAHTTLSKLVGERSSLLERRSKVLFEHIQVRNDALAGVDLRTHPWMTMPMLSITTAVLARLQAHGMIRAGVICHEVLEPWADLARMCPKLVFSDLLLAESLVTHAKHGNIMGDSDV
ncbi:hypothetical protein [Rhodococcus qingshengii]|uniref:hypothetical protein n=1 Tax=Rhodococcus qingshengii TaxID=334542 RepID=UPI001C219FAA|nr:hypothetical protein [Rhodococcus qingshengii]QXC41247.1 hypothetical protein KSE96_19265 [Rhodococcus qingshengii]